LITNLLFGGGGSFGSRGSLSNWGRGSSSNEDWGTSVDWSWGIGSDWSWGIRTDWSVNWSWGRSIGWGRGSIGNWGTLVLDISDISRVGIKNVVRDNLDTAIGKSNTVTSIGGVSENKFL